MDPWDPHESRQWDGVPNWVAGLIVILAILVVPAVVIVGLAITAVTSTTESTDAYGECAVAEESEQALIQRAVFDVLPATAVGDVAFASDFDMDCEFGQTRATARLTTYTADAVATHLESKGFRRLEQFAFSFATTIDGRDVRAELDHASLTVRLDRETAFD